MNKSVLIELKKETWNLYKKGSSRLILATTFAMAAFSIIMLLSAYTLFSSLVLVYFIIPILFVVTLEVYNLVTNSVTTKFEFKNEYMTYFIRGKGLYRALRTFLFSALIYFGINLVATGAAILLMRFINSDVYNAIQAAMSASNVVEAYTEVLETYASVLNPAFSLATSLALFFAVMFASSELRKNEMSFYCLNYLMTDNKVRITPLPMTVTLYRKMIMPVFAREYRKMNLKANYLGYLVFILGFFGGACIGIFTKMEAVYTEIIAFAIGILCYIPFYSYTRIFDALFFMAYGDEIFNRLDPTMRQMIMDGQKSVRSEQPYMAREEEKKEEEPVIYEGGIVFGDDDEEDKE